MGQSKGQEAEKEMNELKHRTSKCRQTADEKTHVRKDSSLWLANIQKVRQVMWEDWTFRLTSTHVGIRHTALVFRNRHEISERKTHVGQWQRGTEVFLKKLSGSFNKSLTTVTYDHFSGFSTATLFKLGANHLAENMFAGLLIKSNRYLIFLTLCLQLRVYSALSTVVLSCAYTLLLPIFYSIAFLSYKRHN